MEGEFNFLVYAVSSLEDLEAKQLKELQHEVRRIKLLNDKNPSAELQNALAVNKNILSKFRSYLNEQFTFAERFDQATLHSLFHGDKPSLFSESEHMTDPFNLRKEVRIVKNEFKSVEANASNAKKISKEINKLEVILKDYLKHAELLFQDTLVIMIMVIGDIDEENGNILSNLEKLKYPSEELKKLRDYETELLKKLTDSVRKTLKEKINSVINIEREIEGRMR